MHRVVFECGSLKRITITDLHLAYGGPNPVGRKYCFQPPHKRMYIAVVFWPVLVIV